MVLYLPSLWCCSCPARGVVGACRWPRTLTATCRVRTSSRRPPGTGFSTTTCQQTPTARQMSGLTLTDTHGLSRTLTDTRGHSQTLTDTHRHSWTLKTLTDTHGHSRTLADTPLIDSPTFTSFTYTHLHSHTLTYTPRHSQTLAYTMQAVFFDILNKLHLFALKR